MCYMNEKLEIGKYYDIKLKGLDEILDHLQFIGGTNQGVNSRLDFIDPDNIINNPFSIYYFDTLEIKESDEQSKKYKSEKYFKYKLLYLDYKCDKFESLYGSINLN